MLRRLRPAGWTSAALAAAVAACTASSDVVGPGEDRVGGREVSSEDGGEGSVSPFCPPDAPRYYAFLASGSCAEVSGSGGVWIAQPLFPEAPADVRERACTYRWRSAEVGSASGPDVEALEALSAELLTESREPPAPCDAAPSLRGSAAIVPVDPDAGGASAPTGVSGCDVCAQIRDRSAFVILPADNLDLQTMLVATSAGRFVTIDLSPPTAGAQAFSVELPPAPDGASYEEGRASLFVAPL
jgi:hypothetical protein